MKGELVLILPFMQISNLKVKTLWEEIHNSLENIERLRGDNI